MEGTHQIVDATARDAVRSAARSHAIDFYLAALLAPRRHRDDLVGLAAYLGEIARIPLIASEPTLGEIRLQWWRDAIEAGRKGARSGNPVADALVEMAERRSLPDELLLSPIAGQSRLLAADPEPGPVAFGEIICQTSGALFKLAAHILDVRASPEFDAILSAAGAAYGRARIALDLPHFLARGRLPVPEPYFGDCDPRGVAAETATAAVVAATRRLHAEATDQLEVIRDQSRGAPQGIVHAILPVALVEPYFRALEKPGRDPLRQPANISPLARAARLWLARWRGVV